MNWTPETIIQLVMGLGVIPALFIWLLMDTRKEAKDREKLLQEQNEKLNQESDKRQQEWIEHMTKSDIAQQEFLASLKEISVSQRETQTSLAFMQKDIEELKKVG